MSKHDYENEKEVVVKKKGGVLGKIIALFLGFLLGIVGCLGGLVGGGYYLVKKKTPKDIFSLANIDYSAYLSEEYATKTIWDMLGATVSTLGAFASGDGTFGDLAAISPAVGDMITGFADTAKQAYGVDINKDGALMNVPLSQLNYHISSCFTQTEAGAMFASFGGGNKVLTALCYGVEGEDYVVENGEIKMLDGKKAMTIGDFTGAGLKERMDAMPLDTLLSVNPTDNMIGAIVYGESHHYTVNPDNSITMNQRRYTLVETQEELFYDEDGNAVEYTFLEPLPEDTYKLTLADESVQYLSKTAYTAPEAEKTESQSTEENPFFYVYSDEACKTPVRYKKTTIGDLEGDAAGVINKIALKDALNVTYNSHGVLIALAYGEEGVDFEFTYDSETGAKTGIRELNAPRTIGDFRGNSQAMIDNIYLTSVISPNEENKIIMYLLYGREGVHYTIVDGAPVMLQKQVAITDGLVYNEYGELIEHAKATDDGYTQYDTDDTTVLARYKLTPKLTPIGNANLTVTLPLKDGQTEAQTASAQLCYVFDENDEKINYTRTQMRDLTGNSKLLSNFTTRLTLSDVLDVTDNKILKHMTSVTIAGLPAAINDLTVGDIFDDDMHYKNLAGVIVKNADGTEKQLTGAEYTDSNGKTVRVGAYIDSCGNLVDNKYEALKPTWKYLLRMNDSNITDEILTQNPLILKHEIYNEDTGDLIATRYYNYGYKVTSDMGKMVENIEDNMKFTPLNEMNEDRIIETSPQLRNRAISDEIINHDTNSTFDTYKGKTLGDLTIDQLIKYVDLYMFVMEDLPNLNQGSK